LEPNHQVALPSHDEFDGYYSAKQAQEVLSSYVASGSLKTEAEADGAITVRVDDLLKTALFKGAKKKDVRSFCPNDPLIWILSLFLALAAFFSPLRLSFRLPSLRVSPSLSSSLASPVLSSLAPPPLFASGSVCLHFFLILPPQGATEYPKAMSLQDLGKQFVSRLDRFVAVRSASTGEVSLSKGALTPIEISSGKKGPKIVTRVQGMEVGECSCAAALPCIIELYIRHNSQASGV
jgi:hypothetical protein